MERHPVGTYLLLQYPLVLGGWHAVGRVLQTPGEEDNVVWVDYNGGGVHLPQMYREDEVGPAEDLAAHGFCGTCRGFGVPEDVPPSGTFLGVVDDDRPSCPECGGSGRTAVRVEVHRARDESRVNATVDSKAVEAITCDACRWALTPQPHA